MANKKYMTGNRALIKINGAVVGFGIQSFVVDRDMGLQDVDGVGSPHTEEHVVGKVTNTITLDRYWIVREDLVNLDIIPDDDELLTADIIDIEVIDKVTGQTVATLVGCSAATHRMTFNKHLISGENATFRALRKQQ